MKSIKFALLFMALTSTFTSCSKDGEESESCEDNNTTKVTFRNVWEQKMRVQVAYQLTPQFEPVNPVVTLDLAPGETVMKEFESGRYMIVWKNDCPQTCSLASSYAKTYETCGEYNEQLSN